MQVIKCSVQDAPALASLNKRLIDDEKSDNPMNQEELEVRMEGFLRGEYHAFFFREDGAVIGYALVKHTCSPLYLRQFFIDRAYRRRHYGQTAFHELLDYLHADAAAVDVLPWNEAGLRFWKSLGFTETCISMKFSKASEIECTEHMNARNGGPER